MNIVNEDNNIITESFFASLRQELGIVSPSEHISEILNNLEEEKIREKILP